MSRVGQRALREPDGIDGSEQRGGDRGGRAQQVAREPEDGEQRGGGDHADEGARAAGNEARQAPPTGEQDGRQRRMRVGRGGDGDQRAGAEEVPRRGDVVAGLVPEVGQAQQREVGKIDGGEEDRVEHPQREWARARRATDAPSRAEAWRQSRASGRGRRAVRTAAPARGCRRSARTGRGCGREG